MRYIAYIIVSLIWQIFREVLDPLSTKALRLFTSVGVVFIALMAVYVAARHVFAP